MDQFFVWTLGDLLACIAIVVTMAIWLILTAIRVFEQAACDHDGEVTENQACDAICRKCGKNLGFIGDWRNENKKS